MAMNEQHPDRATTQQSILVALAVSAALIWSTFSGDIVKPLKAIHAVAAVPYLRSALASLSDIAAMVGLAALAARRSPAEILGCARLGRFERRHLLWGLGVFLPVLAICIAVAAVAPGLKASDFVWPGVLGPFVEELVYRGLAIGILMRFCRWPFAAAAPLPAVFFGLGHLWQGSGALETLGVFAVTAVGGLGFGWLFVRWDSLWPAVIAHVGLNCIWTAFAFGENALGGQLGNLIRLLAILLLIGGTLWLTRRRPNAEAGADAIAG